MSHFYLAGRFEEIVDKMMSISKHDILNRVFHNYTNYYDMYFTYQDSHWSGIAGSLLRYVTEMWVTI